MTPEPLIKPAEVQVLMSVGEDGRAVSFFGDLHPSFAGNVVKAMSSAKQGYPVVSRMLGRSDEAPTTPQALFAKMDAELRLHGALILPLAPTIVEVVVKAPMAARPPCPASSTGCRTSRPGAEAMDELAHGYGGPGADRRLDRQGRIACSPPSCWRWAARPTSALQLRPAQAVILMGPTGHATEIPEGETVLLIGGGLGNAVLFSIGQAMKAKGCRVVYFAGYKRAIDRYKVGEIERYEFPSSGAATRPPASHPTGLATSRSSATSSRRWTPTAAARWAPRRSRWPTSTGSSRSARTA